MKKLSLFLLLAACGTQAPAPKLPQAAPVTPPPVPPGYVVNLCWDKSPSPEVVSYELYQDAVAVQNVTTNIAHVEGLEAGRIYRFWVTAKSADAESEPSNELDYVVPVLSITQAGVSFQVPPESLRGNVSYHLEITHSLTEQDWVEVPYSVTGTTAFAPLGVGVMGFYRARLEIKDASCEGAI